MKKNLNLHLAGAGALEHALASAEDPLHQAWPLPIVELGLALSSANSRVDRVKQIAAAIVAAMSADEQLALQEAYEVPAIVLELAAAGQAFPQPLIAQGALELSEADLDAFKARSISGLNVQIERATARIITGGDRMVLTHMTTLLEALCVANGLALLPSGVPASFPHLDTVMAAQGAPDLTAAAEGVLSRSAGWATANAWIEGLRARASREIQAAGDVAAIRAASEVAITGVEQVVAQLLSTQT